MRVDVGLKGCCTSVMAAARSPAPTANTRAALAPTIYDMVSTSLPMLVMLQLLSKYLPLGWVDIYYIEQ